MNVLEYVLVMNLKILQVVPDPMKFNVVRGGAPKYFLSMGHAWLVSYPQY